MEKIGSLYGNQPISRIESSKKAKRSGVSSEAMSGAPDGVELSSFARELQIARTELSKIPEVRLDKVEELKRRIQDGSYHPDSRDVALKLLQSGVLATEEE